MRPKLLFYFFVVTFMFNIKVLNAFEQLTPIWDDSPSIINNWSIQITGGSNFHVTGIELSLTIYGDIYAVSILGDSTTKSPIPNSGCSLLSSVTKTLYVGANDRVTKIQSYRNNSNKMWQGLRIWFNQNQFLQYYAPAFSFTTNTLYAYEFVPGSEFIGFYLESGIYDCVISQLSVEERPSTQSCWVYLDLNSFRDTNQAVVQDAQQTHSFTPTGWNCPSSSFEYQVTLSPSSATPNLITLTSLTTASIIFAQSYDLNDAKTYTVMVEARPAGQTYWQPSVNAWFTYNHLQCTTTATTLIISTLEPMKTSVLKQTPSGSAYYEQQTVKASVQIGSALFATACGVYRFYISSVPSSASQALSASELTINIDTGLIKLYTADKNTVGTHTATVKLMTVLGDSVTPATATFTITIEPCIITEFDMTFLSYYYDLSYVIKSNAVVWSITGSTVTYQVPDCGYTQTLTSSGAPNFVTITPGATISFSAFSTRFADDGSYTITVTSTLENYNFSPPLPAPTCQSTFVLQAIASCDLSPTAFILPFLLDMTTSVLIQQAGSPLYETQAVKFTDGVSVALGDGVNTCGPRQYSITSLKSSATQDLNDTELTINATTGLISVYTDNRATVGTHTATVSASLIDYFPTVPDASISFTITINPCKVLSFKMSTLSPVFDTTYKIGDPKKTWKIIGSSITTPQFPACGYSFTLTIQTSSAALTYQPATDIQYSVYSNDVKDAGIFLVSVKANLDNYPYSQSQLCQSTFKLTMSDQMLQPYFETELIPQNVTQCSGKNESMWSFTMPKQIDPQNLTVNMTLSFDKTFFDYDVYSMTINQIKIAQKPTNKTILASLQSKSGAKATYSMDVHFVCDLTKNFSFVTQIPERIEAVKKQKQWPKAKISTVDSSGELRVNFLQQMNVPQHPELIQNETITLNLTSYPIIELKVVPGKYSNPDMLKFNWTYKEFTPTELLIQLNFENLNYVSASYSYPDSINLTIYGVQFFQDNLNNMMYPGTTLNLKALPPLASKSAVQQNLEQLKKTKNTLASLVLTMILSGPVQKLLSSFRHTQITVHIMLVSVNQPATALVFFGGLMNLVNFQLIDTTDFYNKVFHIDPNSDGNSPFNNQFELMGYGSLYIVQNFGMLCVTLLFPIIARVFAYVLLSLAKTRRVIWRQDLSKLSLRSDRWLKYGFWVSFLDETYLFLLVCSSLNLRNYFQWQKGGDAFNSLLALVFVVLLLIFPLFVGLFYRTRQNFSLVQKLDSDFMARFGSIIQGLNFKRQGRLALLYPCFSLLRKMWLVYILVFQNDKPVVGIFSVMVQGLIMIAVTGFVNPMTSISENRMQLFNESFVVLLSYHLFPLTDFMSDLELRNTLVGKSLIAFTLFNLGVNIILALVQNFLRIIAKIKLQYHKRKHVQAVRITRKLYLAKLAADKARERAFNSVKREQAKLKDGQDERRIERAAKARAGKLVLQQNRVIEPEIIEFESSQQNRYQTSIRNMPNLLQSRSELFDALLEYTRPEIQDGGLDCKQIEDCKQKVQENKLGVNLQQLGRIQGPVQIKTRFGLSREVVFIFDRRLQQWQTWNEEKMNQMARAAVDANTVSNILVPSRLSRNYVNLKTRHSFIDQVNLSRQGHSQQMQMMADGEARSVILERGESFEQLNQKFPGMVERKQLFTFTSEFYQTLLQLYMIKIDVELVRFGILVDGQDLPVYQIPNINGQNSQQIQYQLTSLLRTANKLTWDFPIDVRADILSDRFASRLKRYQAERTRVERPPGFKDFGELRDEMSFEDLVYMYIEICKMDEQNERIKRICEQGDYM